MVMFLRPCDCTQKHLIPCFKWVNRMVCELYLDTVVSVLKEETARLEGISERQLWHSDLCGSREATCEPHFLPGNVSCLPPQTDLPQVPCFLRQNSYSELSAIPRCQKDSRSQTHLSSPESCMNPLFPVARFPRLLPNPPPHCCLLT